MPLGLFIMAKYSGTGLEIILHVSIEAQSLLGTISFYTTISQFFLKKRWEVWSVRLYIIKMHKALITWFCIAIWVWWQDEQPELYQMTSADEWKVDCSGCHEGKQFILYFKKVLLAYQQQILLTKGIFFFVFCLNRMRFIAKLQMLIVLSK